MTDLPRSPQRDPSKVTCMICGSVPRDLVLTEAGWRCFDVYACARAVRRCPHCEQPTSPGSMHTCNPMLANAETGTPESQLEWAMNEELKRKRGLFGPMAASLSSGTSAGSDILRELDALAAELDSGIQQGRHRASSRLVAAAAAALRSAQERVTAQAKLLEKIHELAEDVTLDSFETCERIAVLSGARSVDGGTPT